VGARNWRGFGWNRCRERIYQSLGLADFLEVIEPEEANKGV
jgi:hypothetical protein